MSTVDLVAGFNIATISHDSKIDWLEVGCELYIGQIMCYKMANRCFAIESLVFVTGR